MGVQEVERKVISQKKEPIGSDLSLLLQILDPNPISFKCTHR